MPYLLTADDTDIILMSITFNELATMTTKRHRLEVRAYDIMLQGYGPLPRSRKRLEVKKLGPRVAYQLSTGRERGQARQYFLTVVDIRGIAMVENNGRPKVVDTAYAYDELDKATDAISAWKRFYQTPIRKTRAYLETP
jgi:hypothetical protein